METGGEGGRSKEYKKREQWKLTAEDKVLDQSRNL